MALTGCSSNKSSSSSGEQVTTDGKTVDLSTLPLDQALKTKYSSLILSCVDTAAVKYADGQTFSSTSAPEFIWDVLENFKTHKTVVLDRKFENLRYQIVMDLEPQLYTGGVSFNNGTSYEFRQHAVLNGTVTSVTKFDVNGHWVMGREMETPGNTKFYEGLETVIMDVSDSYSDAKQSYQLHVACKLEGDLQPGYSQ